MSRLVRLLCLATVLLAASNPPQSRAQTATDKPPELQVIQTVPVETSLRPPQHDAAAEWISLISGAHKAVDWTAFYVSREPGGRLDPVLAALFAAGARGVSVRVLADAGFYKTYPGVLDSLSRATGIEVRLLDYKPIAGGVLHAKYFLIDGAVAVVGSQNTDWRSLEHIWETGLRVRLAPFVSALGRVFLTDWARGTRIDGSPAPPPAEDNLYAGDYPPGPYTWVVPGEADTVSVYPAFSPKSDLPDYATWDLPLILNAMRAAKDSLRVTCLTYSPQGRDGNYWEVLDDELRKAAVRGVKVQLMVSDWSKRKPTVDYLKSLQHVPGLTVRMVTIPPASTGFIPFARVIHSKFMTVDGATFWLGTSNWEKSYFTTTRNVGLIGRHRGVTRELDASFLDLWNSAYAYDVDPAVEYEPPRVGP